MNYYAGSVPRYENDSHLRERTGTCVQGINANMLDRIRIRLASLCRKKLSGVHMEGLAFVTLLSIINADATAGQFWSDDPVTNGAIIAANTLLVVDWAQTRYGTNRPDQFEESGWAKRFTGKHPTTGEVNKYNVTALVLMNTAGYFLPEKASFFGLQWSPKKSLYFGVSVIEAHTVDNNIEAGVKLEW